MASSTKNESPPRDRMKALAQERLKERVCSTFDGLIRAGGLEKALTAWKESTVKQIREIVKNALSDVVEGDLDDKDDSADLSLDNPKEKQNTLSDRTYVFWCSQFSLDPSRQFQLLTHIKSRARALELIWPVASKLSSTKIF